MSKIKSLIEEKIKSNIEEERLVRARVQGFDTKTIWYHVSNENFSEFDLDKTQDGCIWLTKDLDSIKNGETGASINGDKIFIHEFYIKAKNVGGWNEYDSYMDDQLIQNGYDGLLLDNDIKLYNTESIRRTNDLFENNMSLIELKKEFNNKAIFYHGNENKTHKFSECMPSFFTSDPEYAKGYGKFVKEYTIEIEKPFDTATDEIARNYYNNVFLKNELGFGAKKITQGSSISANDADNFWSFISVEELGQGLGYDSIIVQEGVEGFFKTTLSIVPLNPNKIKPIPVKNKSKNKL